MSGHRVAGLVLLSLLALGVAPWLGDALEPTTAEFVLRELRLPRVLLGLMVGATLALTGAAYQTIFENPLASPSTLGTVAGAGLGALAVLVLVPGAWATTVALGAFVGALTASLGLAILARSSALRPDDLVLAGVAVTLAAGAATTGLQLQADAAATLAAVRWAIGSLSTVGWGAVVQVAPPTMLTVFVILAQTRALQAMAAGNERAETQGVDTRRTRGVVLAAGALGVAACVATAGPIAFVGLLVPHLVRGFVGGAPRLVLPLSALVGAGFLPLADGLARMVVPGRDLPVGVLTATLGAPTLLWLLVRRRRG
ncbi:MAG: FecCD family ABC transporter permease [Bradymonadia bacterium]